MSGATQVLKAIGLFYVGHLARDFLLPTEGYPYFILLPLYYLVLLRIVFKYGTSFRHTRLPDSDFTVCIVGAGFSGINMAIKLKELGIRFRLIEKDERLGGTWWENIYPGCACDVPSFMYSYSFELNPNWSRSYSHQPEILRYLERVADKYDITRHIELGKRALNSKWDDTKQKWRIQLDNGEEVTANVVVSGVGALHIPSIPEFPGAESFKGPKFHSARWQKDFDPTGKRVAIIGTGASAVQIVPSIAKQVKTLTVFQRTPCWVPPKDDFAHPKWLNFLFKMYPPLMYCLRLAYFLRGEFGYMMFFRLEGFLRGYALKQMKKYYKISVKDPEVRAKLTPSYEMGCKRVTPSNHYLRSFNRENVTLVTEKIQNFTESGIETVDGTIHEFDCIVYATGFDLTKSSSSVEVYGQNSKNSVESKQQNGQVANGSIAVAKDCQQMSLGKEWADFPNAYKGITTPGYPNLFFLLGPGTGLGHNSVVFMIECQVTYTIDAIKEMVTKNVKSIAVKSEVNTKYQSWVQEWMKNKVFNSPSCVSWYKNTQGVNYTLWPSHLMHYWWVTRYVDLEDYHCKW